MKMRVVVLGILTLGACEKAITIHLPPTSPELVVEGYIYVGKPPVVILTHTIGYFSRVNPGIVDSSFVHGAVITVSDGPQVQTLREYVVDTTGGNKVFFYSSDTSKLSQVFQGTQGHTYSLRIQAESKIWTATTTIPQGGDSLDSLWVVYPQARDDSGKAVLMGQIIDPPQPGNYIRYFTRTNSGPFLPGINSAYDDQLTNGTTYSTTIQPGFDKSNPLDSSAKGLFNRGDTVTVELCNIDQGTFQFWRTYDYSYANTGNPFSSPILVLGNISGAQGYWGGYEQQFKTIIIH